MPFVMSCPYCDELRLGVQDDLNVLPHGELVQRWWECGGCTAQRLENGWADPRPQHDPAPGDGAQRVDDGLRLGLLEQVAACPRPQGPGDEVLATCLSRYETVWQP